MRAADLFRFALESLLRHKVRTCLTLGGVVVGAFLLVVSIAVGLGAEQTVMRQFRLNDRLRRVEVLPAYAANEKSVPAEQLEVKGPMSEEKRKRLRQSILRRWPRKYPQRAANVALTPDRLRQIEKLEHVQSVFPSLLEGCKATYDKKTLDANVTFPDPGDALGARLVAGRLPRPAAREVVVHEYLLYEWGIASDEDMAAILGSTLHLEYRRFGNLNSPALRLVGLTMLPQGQSAVLEGALVKLIGSIDQLDLTAQEKDLLKKVLGADGAKPGKVTETTYFTDEFTVVGVFREWTESDTEGMRGFLEYTMREADLLISQRTAEELFGKVPRFIEHGFQRATVTVDDEENTQAVQKQLNEMGLQTFSLVEIVGRIRKNVVLLRIAAILLAGMALLVAAVGITNTLLMSVLERTHEIGVMKAVGARDAQVRRLFLTEGAVVGLVGGLLGVLLGWLASFPGDGIARGILERELNAKLEHTLFYYPGWLLFGVPVFALVVTTLAAVYPAHRAARVQPVEALREM